MTELAKKMVPAALILLIAGNAPAQRYDNLYHASNADILKVSGDNQEEYLLKGATVNLPNSSQQLNLLIEIPTSVLEDRSVKDPLTRDQPLLFNLKVDIDKDAIQDNITSSKIFITHGNLLLNNIMRPVEVTYVPMPSGTDQHGNFKIYMSIKFNAADFSLALYSNSPRLVIRVNNAIVNRI
jgi:hypothetical protein